MSLLYIYYFNDYIYIIIFAPACFALSTLGNSLTIVGEVYGSCILYM